MEDKDIEAILKGLAPRPLTLCEQGLADAALMLAPPGESPFHQYRTNAIGYARDVLKIKTLTSDQEELLALLVQPQGDDWHGKVAVGAGISVGKTFIGGLIVNWYFDAWGPCIVATTAPSQQSVVDLMWKEVRVLRGRADPKWGIGANDFIGPQAPAMRRAPDWWAKGYVAAKGENFKGRHVDNMMFMFDEAVGLNPIYFGSTKLMFKPRCTHLWICFYNPTDTTSQMYQEIIRPDSDWRVIELSSLNHPNVLAGLRGEPLPIPAAVSLEQVEEAIKDDCEEIALEERTATDFEWRGKLLRPGPNFQGEFLGQWPSSDESAIWSDALWQAVSQPLKWSDVLIAAEEVPRIGCDVARKGDDKSVIHVVWGDCSVFHQSWGGQDTMRTVGRIIELAREWAGRCSEARHKLGVAPVSEFHIPIKVDDDSVGGGVTDRLREQGYYVFAIGAATLPMRPNRYRNKRSELWFGTRDRARLGKLKLGLLSRKVLADIKRQYMAPLWSLNSAGQREVEEKERTKDRLGRSPDDADATNLAFYVIDFQAPQVLHVEQPGIRDRMQNDRAEQRGTQSWRDKRGREGGRGGIFRRG